MKWSKKQQAEWDRKNKVKHDGHAVNNLEQEQALERLKQKLSQPETMAVLKRMKDR